MAFKKTKTTDEWFFLKMHFLIVNIEHYFCCLIILLILIVCDEVNNDWHILEPIEAKHDEVGVSQCSFDDQVGE